MHSCLQVAELLDVICSHLDPGSIYSYSHSDAWTRGGSRSALACAAQTCKTFYDPALRHLWRSVSLVDLFRCLPSDSWTFHWDRGSFTPYKMRLLRPICDPDWERVRFHGARVRELVSTSTGWSLYDVLLSLVLGNCFSVDEILPNLKSLIWHHPDEDFNYIHLFLRSSLDQISLDLSNHSVDPRTVFDSITQKCSGSSRLTHFSASDAHDVHSGSISEFLCRLQRPQCVRVPLLTRAALEHMSNSSHLQSLELEALIPTRNMSSTDTTGKFPALRALSLPKAFVDLTTEFFRNLFSHTPLNSCKIDFQGSPAAEEIHSFCEALSGCVSHSSLRTLVLDIPPDPFGGLLTNVQNRSLRLLLCFPNLTVVKISGAFGFDLDNAMVGDLAHAWRRIEVLKLLSFGDDVLPHDRLRNTLECLEFFEIYCTHLVELALAFDGRAVPRVLLRESTRASTSAHPLERMDVQQSPMTKPVRVASFLGKHFPRLNHIITKREYDDNTDEDEQDSFAEEIEIHDRWKRVEELLSNREELERLENKSRN